MKIKPSHYVLLLFVLLGLSFSSCSNGPAATPSKSSVSLSAIPTGRPTQSIDFTEIKASRPWRIAFIPKYRNFNEPDQMSPYWRYAWEGAQKAGQDFGVDVRLVTGKAVGSTDAENVEQQIRLVADLFKKGNIDGLILAPFDSDRLAPVVEKAIAAGIPVVAMDTPINSDQILTFVVIDNFAAGRTMGEWVVQQLGGRGKVLILDGPQDQQNALDRRNGFLSGLQTGNIDILNAKSAEWDIEPARQIAIGWLHEYPNVDAILAANDDMAIGAAQAAADADRQDILITGFDATDVTLQMIKAGKISATVDQAPGKQARLAIQLLLRHLETGETFPPVVFLPDIPIITKENVDSYLSKRGLK